ncbi:hypothetical protein FS837_005931 [Tulasnella sp. UAMH 9824]|nr:hypothetical protein FS837_005931 [Tulasnella sp. UAMH 9824]
MGEGRGRRRVCLLLRSIAGPSWKASINCARSTTRNFATEVASKSSTAASNPSSTSAALDLIRSQPSHYVIASVVGRKYLLTPRDVLTVPRLNDVKVGDTLALTDIHELGSREFTLRGDPLIPKGKVSVKATVVEHTKGPMEFIVKKKRRKGYKKTIQHKQTYTRLRIGEIDVAPEPSS